MVNVIISLGMNEREGDTVMYICDGTGATTLVSCLDLGPNRVVTLQKLIESLEKGEDFSFNYNLYKTLGSIGLRDGVYTHTWMTCTFMCEDIPNIIAEWKDVLKRVKALEVPVEKVENIVSVAETETMSNE
jgi:hypothetical protein